ncbi:MAG: hypothetical protein Q7W05_08115, partial [Deltaproteobacteria bacterium]|nr:hypothetical protein [Deltaproteobacteria bacterium]
MSNRWQRYELETKLAGFLIVLVLLVINLSSIWLVYKMRSRMDLLQRRQMEVLGSLAQAEMTRTKGMPGNSLWKAWQMLAGKSGLEGIRLMDESGRQILEYNKYQPWNVRIPAFDQTRAALPEPGSFGPDGLAVSPAYQRQGLVYFTAFYRSDPGILALEYQDEQAAAIIRAMNIQVLSGIAGFGLILIIGLFFLRNIFAPFRQMAQSARSKLGGDAAGRPGSDVDLVVKTYDRMVEQLKARGQTLQQLYHSARDRAEQSEQIKQQIVDCIDQALITIGPGGEVSSFNRAAAQLAGGGDAGAVSRWLRDNNLPGLIEDKKPLVWETKHLKYGRRYLQAERYDLSGSGGQISGSIIAVADVTEVRNMEDQARLNDSALLMAIGQAA